jgi:DNA gyrase subunit A
MWLVVTPEGLASRIPEEKTPRQSGSDAPGWLLKVNSRDTLYLVSEAGEAAAVAIQAVPETDKPASGAHYSKFSALKDHQPLAGIFTLPPKSERPDDWFVLSVTCQATVKKTSLAELPGPSANSFLLTRINEGDRLGWLRLTNGQRELLLQSANGMAIRFSESEVRPMGLGTAGVSGMKLQPGDMLAGMELIPDSGEIFMLASDGSAKRVAVDQFPAQGRYGQGVVAWKLPAKIHVIGIGAGKGTTRVTLHLEKLAAKMVRMDAAPLQGRSARGKVIQEVRSGDRLLRLVVPWEVEKMSAVKKEKTSTVRMRSSSADKPAPARSPAAKARAPVSKAGSASKSSLPAKKSTSKGKPASPPKNPKPASSRRQGSATGTKKSS